MACYKLKPSLYKVEEALKKASEPKALSKWSSEALKSKHCLSDSEFGCFSLVPNIYSFCFKPRFLFLFINEKENRNHGVCQSTFSYISTGDINFSTFAAGMVASAASSSGQLAGGFLATGNGMMATGFVSGGLAASITGGNFWAGAVTGLTVAALNHTLHPDFNTTGSFTSTAKPPLFPTIFALKMLGMTVLARIAQLISGSPVFPTAYTHFQYGSKDILHINTSELDFSKVKFSDLDKVPDTKNKYTLDLYKVNPYSQTALVLGKITLTSQGNNAYTIDPDEYNFDIEWRNGITKRNIATAGANILHYGYNPIGIALDDGGSFWINFHGTVIIKH